MLLCCFPPFSSAAFVLLISNPPCKRACVQACAQVKQTLDSHLGPTQWLQSRVALGGFRGWEGLGGRRWCRVGGRVLGELSVCVCGGGGMLIAKLTREAYSASSSLAKFSAWSTCTPTAHRHHAGAANVSSPQRHSAASRSHSHFEATETPERAWHQLACVCPTPPPTQSPACPSSSTSPRLHQHCSWGPKLICSDVTSHITVTIYPC